MLASPEVSLKFRDETLPTDERIGDLVSQLTLEEKIAQMVHEAKGVPRLGISPYNWWSECLHGVARAGRATVFPQAIGMAAAFDPDMMFRIATAISDEARIKHHAATAKGNYERYTGLTYWSPNINIFRDPRWGRGQETYGEDPFLTATLGVEFVRGLQGNHPRYLKIAACAKHFAVHSGPEGERHTFDAQPCEYDLRDTYLPAFKALVEAGVESVMGAYNRVFGEPCCGSQRLLVDILRGEWKFQGHVVSDCWAIRDFHEHHEVTSSPPESAALAISKGCDLNCGCTYPTLVKAVEQGLVTEEDINVCFSRLARTWMKLGMFDDPASVPFTAIDPALLNCDAHRALAKEAAIKSCVLLKNKDAALPLSKDHKIIYVTGPNAASVDVLLGNYYGASAQLTTIVEGIVGKVDPGTFVEYRQGTQLVVDNVNPVDWVTFEASKADAVVAVMGISAMLEGEEGDAIASPDLGDRLDISFPANQLRSLRRLRKGGAKIILVVTGGSPITMKEAYELADAVLWVWYPGEQGGNAVADILFGDVSPSGRLPISFPKSLDQLPPYSDYSMANRTYRYMEEEPLFPFGFGLGYSRFRYDALQTDRQTLRKEEQVSLTVTVTNTGSVTAEEVVQIYLRRKDGLGARQALKAFQRITVDPGFRKEISFRLNSGLFETFDEKGKPQLLPGEVEIIACGSCPIDRSVELGAAIPATTSIRITD